LLLLVHLLNNFPVGLDSPIRKGFLDETLFEHPYEIGDDFLSILFKIAFSGHKSDPTEDLHSQLLACYSANHVDCVLFSLDKVCPNGKDILTFVNVDIILDATDVCFQSLLIVGFELVFESHGFIQFCGKLFNFIRLSSLFFFFLPLQSSSLLLSRLQFGCKFGLLSFETVLSPTPESLALAVLDPI
jgi:hypothetical protein